MTERKFTDEEVIRALEHCANSNTDEPYCHDCPYETTKYCASVLSKDTLDLINRQRAEIERLKAGKQSIKELADELCNRIGETGITDYNTYLSVAELIRKVMGKPCTEDADCSTEEGEG